MSTADQFNRARALEMFESGEGADCVIEVAQQVQEGQQQVQNNDDNDDAGQDKQPTVFNVHKYVLTVNSDVFGAMFSHKNTKEFRESRIQIRDFTANCVRQMLIYMYTGTFTKEQYDAEKDAVPLMKIAHKYQAKSLMNFIEKQLVDSLSLKNVFDRLELADLYQINSLKSACGQLIRQNLSRVKTDAKWIQLKMASPQLALSILEEFADECMKKKPESQQHFPPTYYMQQQLMPQQRMQQQQLLPQQAMQQQMPQPMPQQQLMPQPMQQQMPQPMIQQHMPYPPVQLQ